MHKLFLVILEDVVWCLTTEVNYQNQILREIAKAPWSGSVGAWGNSSVMLDTVSIYFIILLLEKFVSGSVAILSDQKAVLVYRW